ncbi:MAG: metal ABC transporter permease [Halomonadaceae bacterium]|nr:MAG: metal ABC transporter permease [Halomonadaceae bacterium]
MSSVPLLPWLTDPFVDFAFMRRALAGCFAISLSAAPVGVFLMLRRMSLTGDAMAHAILPGAAIGFLLAGFSVMAMTLGGMVAGCLVAALTGLTSRHTGTSEDGNLAAFYLTSLALGVLLISLKGSRIDLLHVLFGATLALDDGALLLLAGVAVITLLTMALLYRAIVMVSLDSSFLRTGGPAAKVAHMALLMLIVLNLVAGFHALGTLMAVGLMILPATIARFWVASLEPMILLAVGLALAGCFAGLLLSYYTSLATSPLIILCLGSLFLLSALVGREKGLLNTWRHRRTTLADTELTVK